VVIYYDEKEQMRTKNAETQRRRETYRDTERQSDTHTEREREKIGLNGALQIETFEGDTKRYSHQRN
jgi:hypothetical protein